MDWTLLLAYIQRFLLFCGFNDFLHVKFVFANEPTLCIVRELVGGGSVPAAVGVSDR